MSQKLIALATLRWYINYLAICFVCFLQQVLATASAVSRANMATSDWLRPFDFDRVFWSIPGNTKKENGDGSLPSEQATQQTIFEGLGERIAEDVLNVSISALGYILV